MRQGTKKKRKRERKRTIIDLISHPSSFIIHYSSFIMNTDAYKRASSSGNRRTSDKSSHLGRNDSCEMRQTRLSRIKSSKASLGKSVPLVLLGFILLCLCSLVLNSILQRSHKDERFSQRGSLSSARKENSDIMERYDHPDSMPRIGDKSYKYAKLRKIYDRKLPVNDKRTKEFTPSPGTSSPTY